MKKIKKPTIILVSFFPVGFDETGGQKGTTELLDFLISSDENVIVFSPAICPKYKDKISYFQMLTKNSLAKRIIVFLSSLLPFSSCLFSSRKNEKLFLKHINCFDGNIIIDHIGSAWILSALSKLKKNLITYSAHNDEYNQKLYYIKSNIKPSIILHIIDLLKIRIYETKIVKSSSSIIAVSDNDIKSLALRYGVSGKSIKIGLHYANPIYKENLYNYEIRKGIVIFGSLKTKIKIDNLFDFLNAWKDQGELFEVTIAGTMSNDLKSKINLFSHKIKVVGFVENPRHFLQKFKLGLMFETRGTGFNVRLIDYLESNTPVVFLKNSIRGISDNDGTIAACYNSLNEMIREVKDLEFDKRFLEEASDRQKHSKLWRVVN